MLKVTFCAYDKPGNVGGPVSWLRRIVPLLRDRGIEVRCLFIMHFGETGPALSSLVAQGVPCSWTNATTTEDRVRWILDELNSAPPDVFVPNLVVAAYFAARWARAAGIRTVGVLHSDDDFYHAIEDEFIFGEGPYRLDAVVPVSRGLEAAVNRRHPAETLVRRIPYGIVVPEATAARNGSALRLGYVGRFAEKQKRISDVVRAMCRAVREVQDTSAVLYGDGPDRAHVEQILGTEGAGLDVGLGGLVDSEEMQQRLTAVDAIVLLSDYEGLPIALLEAMATGCVPVCLGGNSGIPELVVDGETGLIVQDRGDSFVAAIRRLRDEPHLWSSLSRAARIRAAEFSAESSADAWVLLFRELAQPASAPRVVRTPKELRLPAVNRDLASADVRLSVRTTRARMYERTRMTLGRLKRTFFG
jgi:glycosyltransferase involved in cell wall biosynthesis